MGRESAGPHVRARRASMRRARRGAGLALGALWALPLTLPMLAVGAAMLPFGARLTVRGPMLVFTRLPFGPRGALALGQVVLSPLPSLDARVPSYRARQAMRERAPGAAGAPTGSGNAALRGERVHLARHELAHVRQSLLLGPLFPVVYLMCGGVSHRNPFERAADRYARSGRGWWPFEGEA